MFLLKASNKFNSILIFKNQTYEMNISDFKFKHLWEFPIVWGPQSMKDTAVEVEAKENNVIDNDHKEIQPL